MRRVAILGGGPGGLITAHLLDRKCPGGLDVTLFEAGDRSYREAFAEYFDPRRFCFYTKALRQEEGGRSG